LQLCDWHTGIWFIIRLWSTEEAQTFSLEGAETLIPLLDLALEAAAQGGIVEVVMAMAHRGRLNILQLHWFRVHAYR
jgi:hypothetical protein